MSTDTAVRPSTTAPVRALVTVRVPAETAFRVFTADLGRWWPRTSRAGDAALADVVLEPQQGGRWYERDVDGGEHDRGRVLTWQPPHRLVLSWERDGSGASVREPRRASQVEVVFVPEDATSTRVEVVHCGFDAHGDAAEVRRGVAGPDGWEALLEQFAEAAEQGRLR